MRIDNRIIDEAGIERLEHLLWPFSFGVDNATAKQFEARYNNDINQTDNPFQINDLIDLIVNCRTVSTVVGDPKQSMPISPD